MNWIELSIATDAEGAEAAAAALNEFVSGGAVIEETLIAENDQEFDRARAFTVRAYFSEIDRAQLERAEEALWHLAQLRSMSQPQIKELAEEDWANAWKKHYTILHIGKHLVIKPSWLEYEPQTDDVVVELDPGMAFGTGLHPTTRLCMVALEEQAKPGMKMIDIGTGSGILSITAAKLGVRDILALDTDPVAVDTTRRNAATNHVENIIRIEHGSVNEDTNAQRNLFDLVCINILAEIIIQLAPAVGATLMPGGTIIASGILDYKADWVEEAFNEVGIDIIEKKQEEDWVTLVGIRR